MPALSAAELGAMKASSGKDINVSGPTLAAHYLAQELVDEVSIYYVPVVVGSGTPMYPGVKSLARLERIEEHACDNGVTFVRYRVLR